LVWLTTPVAWTVATTTFQEAIRRKWMTALLGFAVVMLAVSTFLTWMQPGEEQKFLRDYGIGFTVIMTLIAAIFLGVALIPPEIERRTIFTILSKPVTRLEFLIGKYLGLMITLLVNLLIMSAIFLLAYSWFVISKEGLDKAWLSDGLGVSRQGLGFDLLNLSKALFLHLGTLSIMAALSIMLSQFLSGITAIIAGFIVYFLGQSASYWERLAGGSGAASEAAKLSPTIRGLVDTVYFVLPRLDRFDARERLVNELPIGLNYVVKAGASGAIYTAVLLTIAHFAFSDREF
jgi:ABC-type transport system involved in multi-copper enzyme maturation permease subunit